MSTPKGGFELGSAVPVAELEDKGITVQLRDLDDELMFFIPDGKTKEQQVTITVAGSYSKKYRRAQNAQTTKAIKGGGRRGSRITGESLREQREILAATCVLAWEGFFNGGEAMDCTRENVESVFRGAPWILEQVEAAQEDHAGFFKKS